MNKQKHVSSVGSYISFNNPKERWRQMNDILAGDYFISTEGRIMRMTPNGIFKEMKKTKQGDHLVIMINDYKNNSMRPYRVARLVLTYFVGGYYKGRRTSFKNKNKMDCSLKNVYWTRGFDTEIDYTYLQNLKPHTLSPEDIFIVEYFQTKNIEILFNLVNKLTPVLFCALRKKQLNYELKNNISSIVLKLSDSLLQGHYKPVSNYVHFDKVDFIPFLINLILQLASEEKKYVLTPSNITEEYFLNRAYLKAQ